LDHLRVQANWTHFSADGKPDFVYMPFELVLDEADVDVQYSITPLNGNHVTLGTGYRFAGFSTRDNDVSKGRHSIGLGWVFIQDELTIGRELFVTAGARLDAHSVSGVTLAPRAAVVWEFEPSLTREVNGIAIIEPGQSVRATAGYGYRTPSLRDLWFNMPLD